MPPRLKVYPVFAFRLKVMKLFAVTAVVALVGLVTETVVPHVFTAGLPEVPKALPRVNPPIVTLASFVVGACGEGPAPLYPLKSQPANTPLNELPPPPPPEGRMVIVRLVLPTPTEFEAVMLTTFVPEVGFGPEITPLVVLMLAHAGRPEAPNDVGEFEAAI